MKINKETIKFNEITNNINTVWLTGGITLQEYGVPLGCIAKNTDDVMDECLAELGLAGWKEVWAYEITNGTLWGFVVGDEPMFLSKEEAFENITKGTVNGN